MQLVPYPLRFPIHTAHFSLPQHLFVDSRNGRVLKTVHFKNAMRSCVTYHAVASGCEENGYECHMTLSDVRRLAPTYAFLAYKEACRAQPNQVRSDDAFFENLAASMHTSKQMLLTRYIVSGFAVAPGHLAGATMLADAAVEATGEVARRPPTPADPAVPQDDHRRRAAERRLEELVKEQEALRAVLNAKP